MQMRTFLISAGVHLAVGYGLWHASEERKQRKATAVVMEDKKPEKKEKPPAPKPPPPPKPAAPKPAAAPVAATAPIAPTPLVAPSAAPSVSTDIHLSNDGPGIPIGDAPKAAPTQKAAAPKPVAAKPPPPAPSAPTECTEEATKPVPVVKPTPEYTDAARAAGVEGRLVVRIYVGADGSVEKVEVVSSVDSALDAAAIATIQKWRFTPSMRCGKPVEGGVYVFAQRFELAGD